MGNLRFKIDWASLIVASKFTVFALFYFISVRGHFSKYKPSGGGGGEGLGLIFGGAIYIINGGFFALPDWRAYIWRGLF